MQREQLGDVGRVRRLAQQHLRHTRVQLAAPPEREPFVGGVADQRVAEPERPGSVRVALDELRQPVPRLRVERRLRIAGENLRDEVARERRSEHGRPAKEGTVAGREAVDARRHDLEDALRHRLDLATLRVRRSDELPHEERVAAGALGDRREVLGRDRLVCRRHRERLRILVGQRVEQQRDRRTPAARLRRRRSLRRAGRRVTQTNHGFEITRLPRWRRRSDDASSIQCASSKWTSVGVSSRCVSRSSTTPFRRARRNDGCSSSTSGVEQHGDVEHVAEQRRPLHEVGRDGLDRVAELDRVALGVAAQLDGEERAQQPVEREVGRRRLVLLARRRRDRQAAGAVADLLDDPRLADAGGADELDEAAEAHLRRDEHGVEHRHLALPVDERQLAGRPGARAAPTAPTETASTGLALPFSASGSSGVTSNAVRERATSSGVVHTARSGAFAISRAASAAVPPRIVYVRRYGGPIRPAKTLPSARPMWSGSRGARVDGGARGSQQALLVVARSRRDARDEDDTPTGGVDVALEEAHAVCVGRGLECADGFLDGGCGSVRAFLLEHLVDPAEPHEGDRGVAVLALHLLRGQMVAQRDAGCTTEDRGPSTSGRPATP